MKRSELDAILKKGFQIEGCFLQTSVTWPGGPIASEKSLNGTKVKGLKMTYVPNHGVYVETSKSKYVCLIEDTNIANSLIEITPD